MKVTESKWKGSFYLTRRCDVDCWYCCVPHVDADRSTELGASGIRTVISNLAAMGVDVIVFGGGEPFLRQDMLPVALLAAREHEVYPVVLTNGRLLCLSVRARATLEALYGMHGAFGLSVSVDNAQAAQRKPQVAHHSRTRHEAALVCWRRYSMGRLHCL